MCHLIYCVWKIFGALPFFCQPLCGISQRGTPCLFEGILRRPVRDRRLQQPSVHGLCWFPQAALAVLRRAASFSGHAGFTESGKQRRRDGCALWKAQRSDWPGEHFEELMRRFEAVSSCWMLHVRAAIPDAFLGRAANKTFMLLLHTCSVNFTRQTEIIEASFTRICFIV